MNKLKKEDLRRARKLRHVFRFIDDLIALNDDDEFLRSYAEIYPKEMELKPENQNTESGSYLDLDLKIDEKVFNSKLYDKRDAFPFSVVRMPHYLRATCHLKCFILQLVPKFSESVELPPNSLILKTV